MQVLSPLHDNRVKELHASYIGSSKIYLVLGVIRSKSLTIMAYDNRENAVELDLQAAIDAGDDKADLGKMETKLKAQHRGENVNSFVADKPLAIGAELLTLGLDLAKRNLSIVGAPPLLEIRSDAEIKKGWIGDPKEGDIFVDVPEGRLDWSKIGF